jgi:hypothetical protein
MEQIEFTNNSNASNLYLSFDEWLLKIGSSYLIDTVHFIVAPLLGSIGLALNLISLKVLLNDQFKESRLYTYLRLYLINSSLICLLNIGLFTTARRYFYPDPYLGPFYHARVYPLLANIGYFYACLLEIIITFDRISILTNKAKLKFLDNHRPLLHCIFLLILCLTVTLPFGLMFSVRSLTARLSSTEIHTFYYLDSSVFFKSNAGKFLSYVQIVIRDLFGLGFQIGYNVYSLHLLKKYLANKVTHFSQNKRGSIKRSKRTINHIDEEELIDLKNAKNAKTSINTQNISKTITNATMMIFIICLMSAIEHILTMFIIYYASFSVGLNSQTLGIFTTIAFTLKHSSNFIVLYLYDRNFKRILLELFLYQK